MPDPILSSQDAGREDIPDQRPGHRRHRLNLSKARPDGAARPDLRWPLPLNEVLGIVPRNAGWIMLGDVLPGSILAVIFYAIAQGWRTQSEALDGLLGWRDRSRGHWYHQSAPWPLQEAPQFPAPTTELTIGRIDA